MTPPSKEAQDALKVDVCKLVYEGNGQTFSVHDMGVVNAACSSGKAKQWLELFAHHQAIVEIEGKIAELTELWPKFTDIQFDGTNGPEDNPRALKYISRRIKELKQQKAALMKGDE